MTKSKMKILKTKSGTLYVLSLCIKGFILVSVCFYYILINLQRIYISLMCMCVCVCVMLRSCVFSEMTIWTYALPWGRISFSFSGLSSFLWFFVAGWGLYSFLFHISVATGVILSQLMLRQSYWWDLTGVSSLTFLETWYHSKFSVSLALIVPLPRFFSDPWASDTKVC